jgi:hypothetical protein
VVGARSLAVSVVGVCWLAASGVASAHFAPAVDANNRYLKLSIDRGTVRLSYTVFFGERPGRALRARLDEDRSRVIEPAEAARFGEGLRAELASQVSLRVDGSPATSWRVADVGLGTPVTDAGAFSVDLELVAPLGAGEAHRLELTDGWQVDRPGETEIKIEAAPPARVVAAHAPGGTGAQLAWAFTGNPAPRRELTIETLGPGGAAAEGPPSRTPLWVALGVIGAAAAGWLLRRLIERRSARS